MTNIYTFSEVAEFRKSFFALIEASENIVITAHFSPDDDSIASVLSTYTILKNIFPQKKIQIVYTGERVGRYSHFHNFEYIQFVDDVASHIEGVDTIILLDCSKYSRASYLPEILSHIKNKLCIDHHASPPEEFDLGLVDATFSSNAELLYNTLEGEKYLTKELAELFLLGILGDTGNLTHIDTHQTEVFSIVKTLVEVGNIRIDSFLSRYRGIPQRIIPLLQEYVKNTTFLEIEGWPLFQYSFVERSFAQQYGFSDEDMSAGSHIYMGQYLPRIEDRSWGFVFSPRSDGGVRMSSRSLAGSVNVRLFHEQIGVGGGHDRASGANFKQEGDSPMEVADCLEIVLQFMKNNKPVLS